MSENLKIEIEEYEHYEDPTTIHTPQELAQKLAEAEEDFRQGRYIEIKNDEEAHSFFEDIKQKAKASLKND